MCVYHAVCVCICTGLNKIFYWCKTNIQDLLTRVEEAVDKYLYWDEEVTIIEAVTSVSLNDHIHYTLYMTLYSIVSLPPCLSVCTHTESSGREPSFSSGEQ